MQRRRGRYVIQCGEKRLGVEESSYLVQDTEERCGGQVSSIG